MQGTKILNERVLEELRRTKKSKKLYNEKENQMYYKNNFINILLSVTMILLIIYSKELRDQEEAEN